MPFLICRARVTPESARTSDAQMNYPQQPYGQAPAPGYPAQPGYPPAQGSSFPQQYAPGYGPYPPFPPQGQPQQPAEVVRGTLADFMSQPSSGGGPSLSFPHVGTRYVGTVVRNVTDADVQAQTDMITGAVAKYNDNRPKLVMKVPLLLAQPDPAYPEGIGVWYVKGNDRAALAAAMEAAGAEAGPPQAGDVIEIVYTHDQPGRRGMNPMKVKRVTYTKGNGTPPQLPPPNGQAQAAVTPGYVHPGTVAPPPQPAPQNQAGPGWGATSGVQYSFAPVPATGLPMPAQPDYAPVPPPAPASPAASAPSAPAPSPAPNGGAPADWPGDVPFIPGLTPAQARIAAQMGHPAAGTGQ